MFDVLVCAVYSSCVSLPITARRLLWRAALRTRQWWLFDRRCNGSQPVMTWIPGADPDNPGGGYHRGGIQRTYCLLFTGHRDQCLGNLDWYGNHCRNGFRFNPEDPEDSEDPPTDVERIP